MVPDHVIPMTPSKPPASRRQAEGFYCEDRRVNSVVKDPGNDDIYGGDETEGLQPLTNRSETTEKSNDHFGRNLVAATSFSTKFDRNNTSGIPDKALEVWV